MSHVLDALCRLILYGGMVLSGVYLLRGLIVSGAAYTRHQWFGLAQRRVLNNRAYYAATLQRQVNQPRTFEFTEHLQNMLETTLPLKSGNIVQRFVWFCVGLAAAVYIFVYFTTLDFFKPLLPALFFLVVPYGFLHVLRRRASIQNSYEIGPVVNILVPRYRMQQGNIYYALLDTIEELPNSPIRRALNRLVTRLQRQSDPSETERAIQDFIRFTGTVWTVQLARLIHEAYVHGLDIEKSLEELLQDITDVQKALKEQQLDRTDNMAVAVAPLFVLPAGLLYFNYSVTNEFFSLQFTTRAGLNSFVLTVITVAVGAIIAVLMYKPKQDI